MKWRMKIIILKKIIKMKNKNKNKKNDKLYYYKYNI